MSKNAIKLLQKAEEANDLAVKIGEAITIMKMFNCRDVVKLEKQVVKARDKSKALRDEAESLRESCEHDWRYTGYDSLKDHFKCRVCGEIKFARRS